MQRAWRIEIWCRGGGCLLLFLNTTAEVFGSAMEVDGARGRYGNAMAMASEESCVCLWLRSARCLLTSWAADLQIYSDLQ